MATRQPPAVTPGASLGYVTAAPAPVAPLAQVPTSGAQPGAFRVPRAPSALSLTAAAGSGTRYIELLYQGQLITATLDSMDFTGAGVFVSNVGSAVTINIPGGDGTPTGPNLSLQFNDSGALAGTSQFVIDPVTGRLTVTGNVHASYFVGSGFRLSNIYGPNVDGAVSNALSAVNANVSVTVSQASQPNITSLGTLTSLSVVNNIVAGGAVSATGNVVTSAGVVATANVTGGNLTTAGSVSATGNIQGGNIRTSGLITVTGNIIAGNIAVSGAFNATGAFITSGNITGGNLVTGGVITAAGGITSGQNVTGGNLISFGSITAGGNISAIGRISTSGNIIASNVQGGASVSAGAFTGTTASLSGNIDGGNLRTAGLISATGTITAVSHFGTFFSASGNVAGGNIITTGLITATGNITGGNLVTGGMVSAGGNVEAANVNITQLLTGLAATLTANIATPLVVTNNIRSDDSSLVRVQDGLLVDGVINVNDAISATGNVTAPYFIGNGSLLTGTYGNADVVANVAALGSNPVSTTGNVTGGNLITAGSITAIGNVQGGNIRTVGLISATGNVTGNYFIGNGSQLTGVASSLSGPLAGNLQGNGYGADAMTFVSVIGNVTAGNIVVSGSGDPTIGSTGNLVLSAANAVSVASGTLRLASYTTAQIANLVAANGDLVYNSTLNKFQGYENGAWANII